MAWSIKNYNAWIKQARKTSRVSITEAREAYRIEKNKQGAPLRGVDVKRSRTFKDSITAAQVRVAKGSIKVRNNREVEPGGISGAGGGGGSIGGRSDISVSGLQQWDDMYDDFDMYEDIEIESSADYGEE